MLLIDATNISPGGGGVLLKFLLESLGDRTFHAIVSDRLPLAQDRRIDRCGSIRPMSQARQMILEQAVATHSPDTLLCFGNLPPRRKIKNTKVVTYFHNAHLIKRLDNECRYDLKNRVRYFWLRRCIKNYKGNTDNWVFQTSAIEENFAIQYRVHRAQCHLFPFFDESRLLAETETYRGKPKSNGYVYVSDSSIHKNHRCLLDAWEILHQKHHLHPELHLTVPDSDTVTASRIKQLNEQNINVINHGILPRDQVLALTAGMKYVIFPSLLETIGLGLVEGCLMDCRVLLSDRKFFDAVINPSVRFDPLNPADIARQVAYTISQETPPSEIVIRNRIHDFIEYLYPQT